ncbi:hypothetical protein SASPL_141291 [Salvia splendens]|uniref:Zinc finger GRF-type domain-containing protein n=1 Tax=Salvia splendens TaxID=180675 RepID=A0A8X8ZCF3_SALSN|nr:hypothetical protein SASPL_141291 [Salvia splendens]
MDNIPVCLYGKGKMEVCCAGQAEKHPGRYYYKCPIGDKHPSSFIWCDEHLHASGKGDNHQSTTTFTPDIGELYQSETTKDTMCIVCELIKK